MSTVTVRYYVAEVAQTFGAVRENPKVWRLPLRH